MKTLITALSAVILCALISITIYRTQHLQKKQAVFQNTDRIENTEKEPDERMTDAIGAAEYEFNLLKNPETGTIPAGIREAELRQAAEIRRLRAGSRLTANAYTYMGPSNLGGRTRSLVYDVRYNGTSNQIILAGGVSGGLFKSVDNGATWIRKSPSGQLFSVTSIAQDTRPGFQDTWYYATGEALSNSASSTGGFYFGNGVYKSTDNGETWTRLGTSNPSVYESFDDRRDVTFRIAVNPLNGHVYLAAAAGIYRSTDAGLNWSLVLFGTLSSSNNATDIVVTSFGRLYAAFGGINSAAIDGVWTSTDGNTGTWTQIAGAGAGGSPAGWNNTYGRIVLHRHELPADTVLFALYDNGVASDCAVVPALEADLFRWNQAATTWTDLSANLPDEAGCLNGNDPFATQGGYDLVIKTKPDDINTVFVGGTNIYRSTDGFTSTANTTRIGGYVSAASFGLYTNSHPDIHDITFQPGSPSTMICSNDGGIQRTTNVLAATVSWTHVATDYRTYQYYHVAIDPRTGNDKVLGGAQDNGTTRNIGGTGANHEMVRSGDGVSVGLSDVIAGNTFEYCGSQAGNISRRNSLSAPLAITNIRPSTATANGLFVTLFKLDNDNTQTIYYANNASVYRNTSASTATTLNWTNMTGIATAVTGAGATQVTAFATTRGTYSAATSSLFIGTNSGDLLRLDDPVNAAAAAAPVNITGAGFPASGNVSSIAVNPRNDDTVIVTFSNYGITSVFWTGNANSAIPTWSNVEGNLTLPSFRSSAIAITSVGVEYFVGTSVGLYNTTIDGASPGTTTWTQDGTTDIGNAVVSSLALRPVDNRLLAGTHGSGMWITTLSSPLPVSLTEFTGRLQRKNVLLEWKTVFEQNSKQFEIEKSYDGTRYKKIGTVAAAGNSSSERVYNFTDPEPAVEINYYRLRSVDMNSDSRLSNVVQIKNPGAVQDVVIGGNPFVNDIVVRFGKIPTGKIKMQLHDAAGKLVHESEYGQLLEPVVRINLTGNRLSAGTYLLSVMADNRRFVKKLLKQ